MLRFIINPTPSDYSWFIQFIQDNNPRTLTNILNRFVKIMNYTEAYPVNFSHPLGLDSPFNFPDGFFGSEYFNDPEPGTTIERFTDCGDVEDSDFGKAIEDSRLDSENENRARGFEWETEGQGSSRQALEDNSNNEPSLDDNSNNEPSYSGKGKGKAI